MKASELLILIVVVCYAQNTAAGVAIVITPVVASTVMLGLAVASLFVIEYVKLPQTAAKFLEGGLISSVLEPVFSSYLKIV